MHFAQLNTATTLTFELPIRPDEQAVATPTFVVKSPSGGVVQDATSITRASTDTTLTGAAAAGSTTVSVVSAASIRVGGRYILGAVGTGSAVREDLGGEVVTVKAKNGTTLTLCVPLRLSHALGESFQSRRISCEIASTTPTAIGRHWRVEVTYSADDGTTGGSVTQPVHVASFDVVRFVPVTYCTWADVLALDPVGSKRIPAGLWWPSLRDSTWEMILRRVAAKLDTVGAGALVGVVNLTSAHAYLARAVLAETGGEEQAEYRQLMAQRFQEEFDAATATTPVDNDGDGSVESNEGFSLGTIELRRA